MTAGDGATSSDRHRVPRAALYVCGLGWLLSGTALFLAATVAALIAAVIVFVPGGIGAVAFGFANVWSGSRFALLVATAVVGTLASGTGVLDLWTARICGDRARGPWTGAIVGVLAANLLLLVVVTLVVHRLT